MIDRRTDDPALDREDLDDSERDPDQQPPFRDEFDVKPETEAPHD